MMLVGLAACGPGEQLEKDMAAMRQELAAQRSRQSALLARIERVESRQAMLAATSPRVSTVRPVEVDPLDGLPIVHLAPHANRAAQSPPLDTRVPLREPSPQQLAELARTPTADLHARMERSDPAVEVAFAEGVRLYNAGARLDAARALVELAREHPRHEVTDNALYLAGLAHAIHDNCPAAEPLLTQVVADYADGDAAAPAMLSLGQCAATADRTDEARTWFERVVKEHPRTPESTQAEAALADLGRSQAALRALTP